MGSSRIPTGLWASLAPITLCYSARREFSCVPLWQGLHSRSMVRPRPPRRLSWFPFLVYLLSFLLVTSFILFEVLDIDGSDFPTSPGTLSHGVSLAEAEHDLRRAWMGFRPQLQATVPAMQAVLLPEPLRLVVRIPPRRRLLGVSSKHNIRTVLPRASLGDAPSA
ncbi:MAG TPA: hypothetical protein VN648_20605 [Candidatus Methylomirabilis sp.]|nr:hypothetical protein [Candidatus Methylomirabilis sp.]